MNRFCRVADKVD
ncbi:Putative uncharacterized protein [Lacticaseibacillus paracasei]|nr:Putative uncharacterized protein [Lacticaseibacillus paracasei]